MMVTVVMYMYVVCLLINPRLCIIGLSPTDKFSYCNYQKISVAIEESLRWFIYFFLVQGEQPPECQDSVETESDFSPSDSLQCYHDNAGKNLINLG